MTLRCSTNSLSSRLIDKCLDMREDSDLANRLSYSFKAGGSGLENNILLRIERRVEAMLSGPVLRNDRVIESRDKPNIIATVDRFVVDIWERLKVNCTSAASIEGCRIANARNRDRTRKFPV